MEYNMTAIQDVLSGFTNVQLSITPTPICRLSRISSHIGHNIYIMREDLTGFAIGGNKVRKLDYLIGDAMKNNANTLVTTKATSFSRNAAAAGKAFGFEVHVVVLGAESDQNCASQALFKQVGAVLHYVKKNDENELAETYNKVIDELKDQGKTVYELHPGGSDTIGSLGYINAFDQIVLYSKIAGVHFNKVIHSAGSTATQVGLVLGQCISEYDTTIIGISAARNSDIQHRATLDLASATANMLNIHFDASKIVVDDRFIGPGYALPSKEGEYAAELFAAMEGVLLDHVYTGKAAAALVEYASNQRFDNNENILFIHTGGSSGLFY